jgi:hypothetical protein
MAARSAARMVEVERHAHHAVADADPLGARGHPGEEDLGGAHVGVPLQPVMLDRPDGVETHLLGQYRLLDAVAQHLPFVIGGRIGHLCLEDHRELHALPPLLHMPSRNISDALVEVRCMSRWMGLCGLAQRSRP